MFVFVLEAFLECSKRNLRNSQCRDSCASSDIAPIGSKNFSMTAGPCNNILWRVTGIGYQLYKETYRFAVVSQYCLKVFTAISYQFVNVRNITYNLVISDLSTPVISEATAKKSPCAILLIVVTPSLFRGVK